ncbi:lytic transglycosylase domain-containing protein [Pelagerythrobacter marensis]|uniref:Lytic transglycosylase domain-containing protein n=1 Tax=Pelagerythrobacter marensis TaxID=543877 RepID=A0ABZ2D1K6_9SPHN
MILKRSPLLAIAACLAGMTSPARADVMEIDAQGARWIAGALSAVDSGDASRVSDAEGVAPVELAADYPLPAQAVADPALHSAAIPQAYARKVHELARRFDLSPALIEALVWQESRWRPDAVSPVGARGLAQLMPGTARELGVDPADPFANLEGGARYLRAQIDRFGGDLEKALAAYNAGPGRVERARGIPAIRETRQYVAAIMGRLSNHSRED